MACVVVAKGRTVSRGLPGLAHPWLAQVPLFAGNLYPTPYGSRAAHLLRDGGCSLLWQGRTRYSFVPTVVAIQMRLARPSIARASRSAQLTRGAGRPGRSLLASWFGRGPERRLTRRSGSRPDQDAFVVSLVSPRLTGHFLRRPVSLPIVGLSGLCLLHRQGRCSITANVFPGNGLKAGADLSCRGNIPPLRGVLNPLFFQGSSSGLALATPVRPRLTGCR